MNTRQKAKKTLESIKNIFSQNVKLREQFNTFIDTNRTEEAHEVAQKIIHTYEVLEKHEKLLINLEEREGLKEFETAQKSQLFDLELLERAVKYLAGHPDEEAKVEKEVEPKERDFLYSVREELKKL